MRFTVLSATLAAVILSAAHAQAAPAESQPQSHKSTTVSTQNASEGTLDRSQPASVAPDAQDRSNSIDAWKPVIIRPPRRFTADDRDAALEAIQFTLSEVADGATFIWYTKKSSLKGYVRPTSSFRNASGNICRHLKFSVRAHLIVHKIEGVACRSANGTWSLEG